MTTKEKQKKVLEALDLRVGDIIIENVWKDKYRIIEKEDRYLLESCSNEQTIPLMYILIYDFEVTEYHQKTYGEYTCKEIHCAKCPLNILNCRMDKLETQTLYECLDLTIKDHNSKVYQAFHNELDKIVEDENEILN